MPGRVSVPGRARLLECKSSVAPRGGARLDSTCGCMINRIGVGLSRFGGVVGAVLAGLYAGSEGACAAIVELAVTDVAVGATVAPFENRPFMDTGQRPTGFGPGRRRRWPPGSGRCVGGLAPEDLVARIVDDQPAEAASVRLRFRMGSAARAHGLFGECEIGGEGAAGAVA